MELELAHELQQLKDQLVTRQEAYTLLGNKVDMWRNAAEVLETQMKRYKSALENIALSDVPEGETTLFYKHLANGMLLWAREALK